MSWREARPGWRRFVWLALLIVSLAGLANAARLGWRIAQTPAAPLLADRAVADIAARVERALAWHATPRRIADALDAALAEPERDWMTIDAWRSVAEARGVALPTDLDSRLAEAEVQDRGFWQQAGACAACAVDLEACALTAVFLCRVPVEITPLGDLDAVLRAARDHQAGRPVDPVVTGLAAAGLAATAMTLPSGGSVVTLKGGVRLMRSLRRMGVLSPALLDGLAPTVHRAVDWPRLAAARGPAQMRAAVDPAALRPVAALASDLGRATTAAGPLAAMRLARLADTPVEARRLANAAEALGARAAAQADVLGKARFLRATVRWSRRAYEWVAAILSLIAGLAGLVVSVAVSGTARRLRHGLHHGARSRARPVTGAR